MAKVTNEKGIIFDTSEKVLYAGHETFRKWVGFITFIKFEK